MSNAKAQTKLEHSSVKAAADDLLESEGNLLVGIKWWFPNIGLPPNGWFRLESSILLDPVPFLSSQFFSTLSIED